MSKTVLITGSSGFIGNALTKYLKSKDYFVIGVDIELPKYEIPDKFYSYDLRYQSNCYDIFKKHSKIDEIYNFGCLMGGMGYIGDDKHSYDIMVGSTQIIMNIIDASIKYECKAKHFYSSSACFIAGTKVLTNKGLVNIEEIDTSFEVVAEDGKFHRVINVHKKNHIGDLCRVHVMGTCPIVCTPDHRFLKEDGHWEMAINMEGQILQKILPDFKRNEESIKVVHSRHVLIYKELMKNEERPYKIAERWGIGQNVLYRWKKASHYPKRLDPVLSNEVVKDYDLGKLLGLILSEGWYETHKKNITHRITACFGKHEVDLLSEYKRLLNSCFGIPFDRMSVYNSRTATKIHVTSKNLVDIISSLCNFKQGSHNKRLTIEGMTGSKEYLQGIMDGANEGDGCFQKIHGGFERFLWSTVSKELASQYSYILKSLGINNSISIKKVQTWSIEGRKGVTKEAYTIYTKVNNTKVQEVEILKTQNVDVYNLDVEDVHSYLVEGAIVHNCCYNMDKQMDENIIYPLKEEDAYPLLCDLKYGYQKAFSEQLYESAIVKGLDIRIARFFNIFGEYGTWEGGKEKAPAALLRKTILAPENGEVEVWGTGKAKRSFLHISECLTGIEKIMENPYNGVVNLGSEEVVTINELAQMCIDISGKNLKIKNIEGNVGVASRATDNSKLERITGWKPSAKLVDGLKTTSKWIESEINKKGAI